MFRSQQSTGFLIRKKNESNPDFENVRFVVQYQHLHEFYLNHQRKTFDSGLIKIEDLHWFIDTVLGNLNCKVVAVFRVNLK